MKPICYLLPFIIVLIFASATGCAATPEDRWHQQRDALNTANEVYLANVPLMDDEQIVHHGELLQAARTSLEQAKSYLPGGGSPFDAALDVVEAILIRLAEPPTPSLPDPPLQEIDPDERH